MRERSERPSEPATPKEESEKPAFAPPVDWWKLDPDERAAAVQVLSVWVPELVRRYGLKEQVVPPCWYLHEALIQELLAFYQYRNQQQVLPVSPPSAMQDLHYQLTLTIARLRGWASETGCTEGEHRPTAIPTWAQPESMSHATYTVQVREEIDRILQPQD